MISKEAKGKLDDYGYRYDRLAEFWKTAKQGIKAPLPSRPEAVFELKGYEIDQEEREEGSAIYFRLFGARCYVAFTHDFSKGTLEYGANDPKYPEQRRRIRCTDLEFDEKANLWVYGDKSRTWAILDPNSVQEAHLTLLSNITPRLVSLFYDAYHDSRS